MTTYSVGDSIALHLYDKGHVVDATFSRGGIPVGEEMHGYFEKVTQAAKSGDTVIVSGGYNGGDVEQMIPWIKDLTSKGVHVAILGLRETGLTGKNAPYPQLDGKTPLINNQLRKVAKESGAVFAEKTIAIANTIPGHEIHGNYPQLGKAALDAAATQSQSMTNTTTKEASAAAPATQRQADGQPSNGGDGTTSPQPAPAGQNQSSNPLGSLPPELQELIAIFAMIGKLFSSAQPQQVDGSTPPAPIFAAKHPTPSQGQGGRGGAS